jgi:DNA polymerase|tara:strand:+ start:3436 stop:5262 length:1827 start_codon:yes stop_codon:yes gene_type:complete
VDLITIDFETYYDKEYSLSKLTTEEYIRDYRFQVIGVSVKVNSGEAEWASGTHQEIREYLHTYNWGDAMFVAHNTMFDGAIASWVFGISPRIYTDTLCISRAVDGVEASGSLKALAERYSLGVKGTEVTNALGKHREDFTPEELSRYGDYCINDANLTYDLFEVLVLGFPKEELKLIDLTLRMFIEPTLDLDLGLLEQHLIETRDHKDELLGDARADKKDIMSNPKFAKLLEGFGVKPPMKVSPVTGGKAFAFAKSDVEFNKLAEHENPDVQSLMAARLGNKSTLEETRTQRFIDIAKRGLLPVPVKYYAAHTGRWGGDDKINLQNLPSRGAAGKKLKRSIIAPEGHSLIEADSAQIEARVLAWLAEQDDLVDAFAKGEDVYKKMASRIYGVPEEDVDKDQRFVGKTTILGAGYGMGAVRFTEQLKSFGFDMGLDEARRVINIYRSTNDKINQLWKDAQDTITNLSREEAVPFGRNNLLTVNIDKTALELPSGLLMRYSDLEATQTDRGYEFDYKTRKGRIRIYGGKVVENVCQALARCIIGHQMIGVSRRYKVVLTVHDSIVCCVPDDEVAEARSYIEACMREVPDWANGLPVDCESGVGKSYGDCE